MELDPRLFGQLATPTLAPEDAQGLKPVAPTLGGFGSIAPAGFWSRFSPMNDVASIPPTNPIAKVGYGMGEALATLPQRTIEAAAVAPMPGLRKEDYTDDPTAPDPGEAMIKAAGETALTFGALGLPFAKPGTAGVFGGRLAKTADHDALAKAETLDAAGTPPADIWDQTGWTKGADDQWRFEIPDDNAKFMRPQTKHTIDNFPIDQTGLHETGEAFLHPELYAAYPDLAKMPLEIRPLGETKGAYRPPSPGSDELLFLNQAQTRYGDPVAATRSTMLHELQHAIQQREGFARGSSPDSADVYKIAREKVDADHAGLNQRFDELSALRHQWLDDYAAKNGLDIQSGPGYQTAAKAFDQQNPAHAIEMNTLFHQMQNPGIPPQLRLDTYKRFAGEVEARNVQHRDATMTPEERQAVPPVYTQEVPNADQIVKFQNDTSAAAATPLPMDEVSRMQRAADQGYTIDAFHGTSADPFDAFKRKKNDIGVHFGTAEQANDRLSYMAGKRPGDPHVYPVKLKVTNPLRVPDLGSWRSENIFYGLGNLRDARGLPLFDKEQLRRAAFTSGNEAGRTAALRNLIEQKGYDGLIYKNTGETGGSEPFRQAVDAARAKVDEAFGPGKTSFTPADQQHPAYQEWTKANRSYDRHREENGQDSYIAFRPEQVRSKFAAFDPTQGHKGGLMLSQPEMSVVDHPAIAEAFKQEMGPDAGQAAYQAYVALHGAPDVTKTADATAATPIAGGRDVAGGAGGGVAGLSEAQAAAARRAGARQPLEGLPRKAMKIGDEYFVPGPIGKIHDVAEQYMKGLDRPYAPPTKFHPLDPEHSAAIARAFEEMPHTPNDPATKASYDALIKETQAQYNAIKQTGLKIEPITPDMPDPYAANPRLAAKDVADNNHLWYFPTDQGFGTLNTKLEGPHPMMRDTGETLDGKPLLANDMFRIVHDYFGHLKEGHGFRAGGEDNAYRTHSAMYSDLARPAMTTETRGQNSWVNYGPHGDKNRTASAADTIYADQKVGLMPEWTMRDRGSPEPIIAYHGTPHSFDEFNPAHIGAGEGNQAYGRGLYFAEHEPVSEWYRHQLAARRDPLLKKYGLDSEDGANVGMQIAAHGGDAKAYRSKLQEHVDILKKSDDTSKAHRNEIERTENKIKFLSDPNRSKGHLYQVAIDHPQEAFLDWDKRFTPEEMEQFAAKFDATSPTLRNMLEDWSYNNQQKGMPLPAGEDIVRQLRGVGENDKDFARTLKAAGIPGIKYMDQGSRLSSGKKTRNYVTFDAPRILKKYAVPGAIGAGGFGALAPRQEQ